MMIRLLTKNIDYTPDITSAEFWDRHHVVLTRVVGIGEALEFEVLRQFSTEAVDQTLTFAPSELWFGLEPEPSQAPKVDDLLVLYIPKEGPAPVVVRSRTEVLVRRLQAIAGLRAGGDDAAALRRGVFDPDPEVARYCLRRLLEAPVAPWPAGELARLRALRDDASRTAAVRLLAAELVERLEGRGPESPQLYDWLRAAILGSKEQDWTAILPFVRRLVSFGGRRAETVDFLTSTATNEFTRQPIRIAAYSAFDDGAVFHFREPDAESDRVFEASERMLRSRSPLIRRAGAALLHNLSAQIAPEVAGPYLERARSGISAAVGRERNEEARQQMSHFADLLAQRP